MYILLLTYLLNGVQYNLPIEEYAAKSYCDTSMAQTSKELHRQGAKVLASSCVWVEKK